jgi:hypothetical protein
MNDLPYRRLLEIVQEFDESTYNNPRRCYGLLLDRCGEYRRENYALISALENGIPYRLLDSRDRLSAIIQIRRWTTYLLQRMPLDKDSARWAVEAWAMALA